MLKRSVICRLCMARKALPYCQWRWKGSISADESPLRRLVQDAADFGEGHSPEPELSWATEPYAARPDTEDDVGEVPQHTTVLLFPDQPSKPVDVGRLPDDVPAVRDLYELASSVVGRDVRRAAGSEAGALVGALAALEALRERRPAALQRARAAAGLRLGELAALVWAGALALDDTLRLLALRAEAVAAAAAARPGGQLALWLAPAARLPPLLARAARAADGQRPGVCAVAAYLYPGCRLVAGDLQALRFVEEHGAEYGVRRAARRTGPAAHSALMDDVERALRPALAAMDVRAPRLRVLAAADARRYGDGDHVRRQLARQLARPVLWEQTLQALYARPRAAALPLTLALGPGDELRAGLRRVNARAWDASVQVRV